LRLEDDALARIRTAKCFFPASSLPACPSPSGIRATASVIQSTVAGLVSSQVETSLRQGRSGSSHIHVSPICPFWGWRTEVECHDAQNRWRATWMNRVYCVRGRDTRALNATMSMPFTVDSITTPGRCPTDRCLEIPQHGDRRKLLAIEELRGVLHTCTYCKMCTTISNSEARFLQCEITTRTRCRPWRPWLLIVTPAQHRGVESHQKTAMWLLRGASSIAPLGQERVWTVGRNKLARKRDLRSTKHGFSNLCCSRISSEAFRGLEASRR
jgi:hypothetical protein